MPIRTSKDPDPKLKKQFEIEKADAELKGFEVQDKKRTESILRKQEAEQRVKDKERAAKTPVGSVKLMIRCLGELKEEVRSGSLADEDALGLVKVLGELEQESQETRGLLGGARQNLLDM